MALSINRCRRSFLLRVLAWAGALLSAAASAASLPPSGIVVEEVLTGTASEKAGLLVGDVLVSWSREPSPPDGRPAAGGLATPFDLADVFIEQVPRNTVTLEGRRGDVAMSWDLAAGSPSDLQGLRTEPLLSGDLLATYERGEARLAASDFEAGVGALRSAAAGARAAGAAELAAWFLAEAARELARQDRWGEADTLYGEALSPELPTFVTAQLLREWGELFQRRFAWDRAEDCFERALAADRQRPFETLAQARSLIGLGLTDNLSRGPQDDDDLFRQAMEVRRRLAPGSADEALSWYSWGKAAALDRDWETAVEYQQRAVRMLEPLDTSRLLLAEVLARLARALARTQEKRGEAAVAAAQEAWLRAHDLVRQEAPEGSLMIAISQGLGEIASAKGDPRRAEELLAHSLDLSRRLAPASLIEAEALHALGRAQLQNGKLAAASGHLCQAADLATSWRRKLQSNEELRSRWGLFFADYYRECADSLVQIERAEDAFLVLEEGRARAFLDLRAERGVRLAALPPERSRRWQDLNAEYDRTLEELEAAGARPETRLEQMVSLEGRLREIRRRKERLLEQDLAPGAVRYPEPVFLGAARRGLEPGTVLLYYSVGRTRTLLFVLSPEGAAAPGWAVVPLAVGARELGEKVDLFRKVLIKDRFNTGALAARSRPLYDLLVGPAEPYLRDAERLVLSPDGPLHTLPFAALLHDGRYLIERKPLHLTLSATVYLEHLSRRPPPERSAQRPAKLVAFGDPLYSRPLVSSAQASADPLLAEALRAGVGPLPATRREVEGIARLFTGARVVTGDRVTEETVKEEARGASLLHFAVHGLLNQRTPLNSALVLSPSRQGGKGRDNGLLQAWEVMESLPLDADLVTLSACDTALGEEVGGEGLIGLTRAFQYAGARSVVATLWGISDRSTASFMLDLYTALRAGKPKDEALRDAQLAQIRHGKPQPFYWAAFQLFGDWR